MNSGAPDSPQAASLPPMPPSRVRSPIHPALLCLLPALLAVLIYLPTLRLPLIYDSLLHIRIAGDLNLASVWLPTEKFGFYRPLTFLPLLLVEIATGEYPAWLLHSMNVTQHALNAGLLAGLSWCLWRRPLPAVAAGALLALYPFSYQAVAVYGHNVHPATANLLLIVGHAFLSWRAGGRKKIWLALLGLLFILGLLSHESAFLFGPFLLLLAATEHLGKRERIQLTWLRLPPFRPGIVLSLAGVAYVILYQFLPLSRAPDVAGGGGFIPRALYLLQALTYPLAGLLNRLPFLTTPVIMSASLIFFLLLIIRAGRATTRTDPPPIHNSQFTIHNSLLPLPLAWSSLLLGGSWFLLSSLLVGLPLTADYLLHGPRLLYLGSVGVALVWAGVLFPRPLPLRYSWLNLLAALVILGGSGAFVSGRLAAYERLTEPVDVSRQAVGERDAGILFLNLPAWYAPPENTFPVGVEYVSMLGGYLFIGELTAFNGLPGTAYATAAPDLLADVGYGYSVHQQHTLSDIEWAGEELAVILTRFETSGPVTTYTGSVLGGATGEPLARFGPFTLLAAEATHCDGEIQVEFSWQLSNDVAPTTSLFVQALQNGTIMAQADGPPLGLRLDALALPDGWHIRDRRTLDTHAADTLLLGAYNFASGERLAAVGADGASMPDNALAIAIQDCAQE